jgi:hypothetical protein
LLLFGFFIIQCIVLSSKGYLCSMLLCRLATVLRPIRRSILRAVWRPIVWGIERPQRIVVQQRLGINGVSADPSSAARYSRLPIGRKTAAGLFSAAAFLLF